MVSGGDYYLNDSTAGMLMRQHEFPGHEETFRSRIGRELKGGRPDPTRTRHEWHCGMLAGPMLEQDKKRWGSR